MPAPLPAPATKRDVRFYNADINFLDRYLRDRNTTFNDLARDLVHRYANAKREQLGLAVEQPHPPGQLP